MQKHHALAILILAIAALGIGGYFSYNASLAPENSEAIWLYPRLRMVHPNNVRGVYMTSAVAKSKWPGAALKRNKIMKLIETTELNGLIIDVKESEGSEVGERLKKFVQSLYNKPVWSIARVVAFADNSQVAEHPDWYLTYAGGAVWRDKRGNAWLDPANPDARRYIIDFCKSVIDIGFDEIQFDYIRYPSDGSISAIKRSRAENTKQEIIREVFETFSQELRAYDPTIRLSVDLFGYVTQRPELSIGQSLEDAVPYFDYISPMVYPSHYYSGFSVKADEKRDLPAVSLSAYGANTDPETVIYRSLLTAQDTIFATTTKKRAKLRPWLQDFSMGGVKYGEERVRAQIDAAEKAGSSGWLLWNASNRYTEATLNAAQ